MAEAAAQDSARRVAVLIGQNRFPNAEHLTDLQFAESDMEAIGDLLLAQPGRPYDKVVRIPTGSSHAALEQLEETVSTLDHEDTILVYYSGHGVRDRRRRLYLAFENTNEDRLSSTALKVGHVLDLMQSHNARRRILVLDCCYAGAVGAEFDRSGLPEQVANEVHGAGTVVLTAATKVEIAKEDPVHGHGIFTRHFLDGMAGAADVDGDGIVTSEELFHYVHDKVTAETAQKPQRFNHELEGRIVLRETGLTPWKDKAARIRSHLFKLASEGELADRLLTEALEIVDRPPARLTPEERKLSLMLQALDPETYRAGQFANDWDRRMEAARRARPAEARAEEQEATPLPEPPQKPEPQPEVEAATPPPGSAMDTVRKAADFLARDAAQFKRNATGWIDRARTPNPPGSAPPGDSAEPAWKRSMRGEAVEPPPSTTTAPPESGPPARERWYGLGATGPVPGWYANLSLLTALIAPLFFVAMGLNNGGAFTAFLFGGGTVALCLWSAHSKWTGGAAWRKVAYYIIAGFYGLLTFAILTAPF